MGEHTEILWADSTFNPVIGCTEVSIGEKGACTACYARELAKRYGWAKWGNHPRERTSEANWKKPLAWNRKAAASGKPWFVFGGSLCDPFDNQWDPQVRRDYFDLIRATPQLTWLLLTKRPQNVVKLFVETITPELRAAQPLERLGRSLWPTNAAIGCTVVTQAEADRDIPVLLGANAALHPAFAFVSMEPLMEEVNILPWLMMNEAGHRLDWVITGGMTDQGKFRARPTPPHAFRSLRDQCAMTDVPFLLKQHGEHLHGVRVGKKAAGRLLDGVLHDARPTV